jgi:hypothetical protein
MEGEFRYRGRIITAAEVEFIRQLIAAHPHTNRRQLSLRLCEAWGWKRVAQSEAQFALLCGS